MIAKEVNEWSSQSIGLLLSVNCTWGQGPALLQQRTKEKRKVESRPAFSQVSWLPVYTLGIRSFSLILKYESYQNIEHIWTTTLLQMPVSVCKERLHSKQLCHLEWRSSFPSCPYSGNSLSKTSSLPLQTWLQVFLSSAVPTLWMPTYRVTLI